MTTTAVPGSEIPYDQRLARLVVRPLVCTPVHPNHLTTLSLLFGLTAALLFALGGPDMAGLAAGIYMLAVFTDHTDGELARLSGRTSPFGHRYDFIVGGVNYTMLFIGIGVGLSHGPMGIWALLLGFLAGLSNPLILTLRMRMEERFGKQSVKHPYFSGFEIEDFIYLIGPITWLLGVHWFFIPYGLGTLAYVAWTICEHRRWRHIARSVLPDPLL
ncbi:MAG: CDP-alcohol phosphatidyltransferase family protein [Chromatiales bacterium]